MKVLLVVLSALSSTVISYRILVIAPIPSRSHGALAQGIVTPLLEAGHQVTWASPYLDWEPHKNLRLINIGAPSGATLEVDEYLDITKRARFVKDLAVHITEVTIHNKELQDTLVNENYDAVVTQWFYSDTDAGFAAVQQVPWILFSGLGFHPQLESQVHDIISISTVPITTQDFAVPMNFLERVVNTITYAAMWVRTRLEVSSVAERYVSFFAPLAESRGVQLPKFNDALFNVSIMLINSDPLLSPAQSLPPNVVNIGGHHIKGNKLPKDVQEILDSSPQGVVYFSMGSVLKSSVLSTTLRQELITIFSKLPYMVLWKFEANITGLPENIVVRKWWPQAGVLAHPNVKLFITHGGMLSTTEAVHHGVPLLAIPVFGDQPSNAARAVEAGYALKVPYSESMGPALEKALSEMLSNDSYYQNAKYISKIFNKRPAHPSKLVTHCIELAIESKGAYHLRSKTHLYAWYERWLLDQLLVLLAALCLLYTTTHFTIRLLLQEKKHRRGRKLKMN